VRIKDLRIIFLAGIHGVGKTQFSTQTAASLGMTRLSASELITQQRNAPAAINKRVDSVDKNQSALIVAIEAAVADTKSTILLDGHFCVFDYNDQIKRIPLPTFRELSPKAVVLLRGDPAKIRVALRQRDGRAFEAEVLKNLQDNEIAHAKQVCEELRLPLHICAASELIEAQQFIARHGA
jgi:adenylate kinase